MAVAPELEGGVHGDCIPGLDIGSSPAEEKMGVSVWVGGGVYKGLVLSQQTQ